MAVSGSPGKLCYSPQQRGGHHHGGNGVIRRLRFLEPMTAAILSGRRCCPFGLQGGEQQPWAELG